ncbi:MAG: hypothetical protein LBG65_02170 [Puniceicoccales bacterium]|jgi:hypothetical protein|nr:hypothetical protein [Puniceicoccales bacterium]
MLLAALKFVYFSNPVAQFSFLGLPEWWNGLDAVGRVYGGVGLAAGVVTLVLLMLTVLGLDQGGVSGALDADISSGVDVHVDGSLFSTRSIAGFFLGFGGGASIAYESTNNPFLAGAVGFVVGLGMFYAIYLIGKKLLSLQSNGTVDFAQAVGSTGSVYVTIPPARQPGGQAQVVFNNRHEVIEAISDSEEPIPAGANIRVKQRISGKLFLVESV